MLWWITAMRSSFIQCTITRGVCAKKKVTAFHHLIRPQRQRSSGGVVVLCAFNYARAGKLHCAPCNCDFNSLVECFIEMETLWQWDGLIRRHGRWIPWNESARAARGSLTKNSESLCSIVVCSEYISLALWCNVNARSNCSRKFLNLSFGE